MSGQRWGLSTRFHHKDETFAKGVIVEAARRCYVRNGLHVTGADVGNEAKVTRQTVYKYFDSIEQVRILVVKDIWLSLKPQQGLAIEWVDALQAVKAFRLGPLPLSIGPLFTDLETVVLCEVQTVQEEAIARLFLSYLKIDALTGDPLPVFHKILGTSEYVFENGQAFNPSL
jgi:AcrR family transcriptional regulator